MLCEPVSTVIGGADDVEPRHEHEEIDQIFFEVLLGVRATKCPEFCSEYDEDEKSKGFPTQTA